MTKLETEYRAVKVRVIEDDAVRCSQCADFTKEGYLVFPTIQRLSNVTFMCCKCLKEIKASL